jgi:hypothetical protein
VRYHVRVAVSDRERDYMRRLGAFKAHGHAEMTAAHLALPIAERLARSIALMRRFWASASDRQDDPTPLYDRAKRLGLYRP